MSKGRLEAFSDGVLAIVITIMVLGLSPPPSAAFSALFHEWRRFAIYALSFTYVGIYWNNHHHTFQATRVIDSRVLWANLHLRFWLSLVPFSSDWMGEHHFDRAPTIVYAFNMLACAIAYTIMLLTLIGSHGRDSHLARAIGNDRKGKLSVALYVGAILCAWLVTPLLGFALTVVPALIWLVPDRRMERAMRLAAEDARLPRHPLERGDPGIGG